MNKFKLLVKVAYILATNPILRAFGRYDHFGFRYSPKQQLKMKRAIALLPTEKQAKYAHKGMINYATDANYLKSAWTSLDTKDVNHFRNMDATAIGNLAYMALHSHGKYQQKAKEMLQGYKQYVTTTGSTKIHSLKNK